MQCELKISRFWTNDMDEADREFIKRRIGIGNSHLRSVTKLPYTREMVRDLLQNPIGVSPSLFSEEDRSYFRNLRRRRSRVTFDNLPVGRNVYHSGKTYFQGPEDTCLAYCIVNGLSMLRSSVPEEIFLGLTNDSF